MERLLEQWTSTRVVLFTMTPCGGTLPQAPRTRPATPAAACEWVAKVNSAIKRVALEHAPRVSLLDAHQMVASRPGSNVSGTPPGIWLEQVRGWHMVQRDDAAAQSYRGAGDMYRMLANRLFDVICP